MFRPSQASPLSNSVAIHILLMIPWGKSNSLWLALQSSLRLHLPFLQVLPLVLAVLLSALLLRPCFVILLFQPPPAAVYTLLQQFPILRGKPFLQPHCCLRLCLSARLVVLLLLVLLRHVLFLHRKQKRVPGHLDHTLT